MGSERRAGYLSRLGEEDRQAALAALSPKAREIAGALIYSSLPPTGQWRANVYEWQPFVFDALDAEVVSAGEFAAGLATLIKAGPGNDPRAVHPVTPTMIDEHLYRLAFYLDDKHWCQRETAELGLQQITISSTSGSPSTDFPVTVTIEGLHDLMTDPRAVSLIRHLRVYKKPLGLILQRPITPYGKLERISLKFPNRLNWSGGSARCDLNDQSLATLEQRGLGLDALAQPGELSEGM